MKRNIYFYTYQGEQNADQNAPFLTNTDSNGKLYSRRLASGTRQPSGTPLKNTFKLVNNARNWSSKYIWI